MSYTGDRMPSKIKLDKEGKLIDPEDELIDNLMLMLEGFGVANCYRCKHLNQDEVSCKAFPNVIPSEILTGKLKHNRPYKDDNGIQFEPIEDEKSKS